jgi:hypothetical protein
MIIGLGTLVAYIIYALGANAPQPESIGGWASALLVFIGIGIAVQVVVQVLFHIFFAAGIAVTERNRDKEEVNRIISASMAEDERDKMIQLKASHIGYIFAGCGVIAFLLVLAFKQSVVTGMHIIIGAFFLGSLVEGIVSVVLQEKGVRNG